MWHRSSFANGPLLTSQNFNAFKLTFRMEKILSNSLLIASGILSKSLDMNIFQTLYNAEMEIQRVVSDNLIRLRGEMSRQELAKRAGVTYQHIYEIEELLKNPSLKVLDRVAKALNVEVEALVKTTQTKPVAIKISQALRMMSSVPDEIYELAAELEDPMSDVWDDIAETLMIAIQQKHVNGNGKGA